MTTLVLVTGAGASHKLGPGGGGPPLMAEWAADLCERIAPHVGLLGLRRDMGAEAFEERLGAFLRLTRSLADVAVYPRAGLTSEAQSDEAIRRWFMQASTTCNEIANAIYASLHELFGASQIGEYPAKSAYGPLLESLQVERLVYCTTNYDIAGEVALEELDRRPYAGIDAGWRPGRPQRLHFEDLISDDVKRTPVLHLHGRVGWYRAENNEVFAIAPDSKYIAERGTPALLLPEPTKSYDDVVSEAIWQQFSTALDQATHVLVVGHSLNDAQLTRTLRNVPDNKLAISIHASRGASSSDWQEAQSELLNRLGRAPHVIPMDFGPDPCADLQRLGQFVSGLEPEHGASSSVRPLTDA